MKENQFNELLLSIIKDNQDTEFGKKYQFNYFRTVDGYRYTVPFAKVEDVTPFIELTTRIGEANIFTKDKILAYALTSGTSQINHYVPCNKKHIDDYVAIFKEVMKRSGSKLVLFESIPTQIIYSDGAKLDTIAGIVLQSERKNIKKYHLTSPEEILYRKEASDMTYLRTLFALSDKNVSTIVAPFTWPVISMIDCIIENSDRLINDIRSGEISFDEDISDDLKVSLQTKFKANPKRADKLEEVLYSDDKEGLLTKIWPNLKEVIAAGTGRFEIYSDNLKKYLGTASLNNGYFIASEAIVGKALVNSDVYKLCTNNAYIEFKPLDSDTTCLYDEVEVGEKYSLYITNKSGLFRYRLGDIVEVVDLKDGIPYFKYVSRTNETVSEASLYKGIKRIAKENDMQIDDFCFLENKDGITVYLETKQLDKIKRRIKSTIKLFDKSLNVKDIKFLAPGFQNKYKRFRALDGNMAADQIKPVRKINNHNSKIFFDFLTSQN